MGTMLRPTELIPLFVCLSANKINKFQQTHTSAALLSISKLLGFKTQGEKTVCHEKAAKLVVLWA